MSREAMKLALEALEKVNARSVIMGSTGDYRDGQLDALSAVSKDAAPAITAIREALAEQPAQQEPVAQYIGEGSEGSLVQLYDDVKKGTNFYTFPPAQRTWVGLTYEEVRKVNQEVWGYVSADHARMRGYAQAIEAKLKEKNNG